MDGVRFGALPTAWANWQIWWRLAMPLAVALIAFRWLDFATHPWVVDQWAYWSTRDGELYGPLEWPEKGAYVYSPAFAQLVAPLTWMPFAAFNAIWMGINILALVWLAGPYLSALLLWVYHPVWGDNIRGGNIYILLGVAVALAVRYPAAWAFPVLTKVTPGIGAGWYLGRREWAPFALAVAATLAIAAFSMSVAPEQWARWINLLAENAAAAPGLPLAVRLPMALGLAVVAGWRRWFHLLPIAVVIAMPQVGWSATPVLLASIYWLRQERKRKIARMPGEHNDTSSAKDPNPF